MAAELPEPASSLDAQLAASSSTAAAAVTGVGGPNPCCAKLWKKYQKLETSRTALREAVKLLQAEKREAVQGELGAQQRSFVDDVAYEEGSVTKLRNRLSSLLTGTSFVESWSLSVQFTAIGALVSILPLPFDKIVATESRQLSSPFVVQVKQISEWFVQLSSEHQSLARSFLN